jgi:hypothetical protein
MKQTYFQVEFKVPVEKCENIPKEHCEKVPEQISKKVCEGEAGY